MMDRYFLRKVKVLDWGQDGAATVAEIAALRASFSAASGDLIQLGCACKDELGIAHVHCAEVWFKLKGNRYLPAGFRREFSRQTLQQYEDTNLGDVVFEFLDDCDVGLGSSSSSDEFHQDNHMKLDVEEDDDKYSERVNEGCNNEENINFWDNQLQLLQTTLFRTSSVEISIRNATKEAIEKIDRSKLECSCSGQSGAARSCPNCFMRQVSSRLQNAGFNSAICNTKWTSSHDLPSGEHTFLDVMYSTSKEKTDIRVIVELNFRAQFDLSSIYIGNLPSSGGKIGVDGWMRVPSMEEFFALEDCAGFLEQAGRPMLPALAQVKFLKACGTIAITPAEIHNIGETEKLTSDLLIYRV